MSEIRPYGPSARRVLSVLLAVILPITTAGAVAACGRSEPAEVGRTFTVGLAVPSLTTPSFLIVMNKAFHDEADKLGLRTEALGGDWDAAKQAANVGALVDKKVDLIVVCSSSPTAVLPSIKRANAAGIPVIALNAQVDPGAEIVTYVGASDLQFGQAQGQLLVEALPKGGKVAVIQGPRGNSATIRRLTGNREVLRTHRTIRIVDVRNDDFANDKNLAATKALLRKYPKGKLQAVVAHGPQMYVGAGYARKVGRTDVTFIAGDYSKQVEAAVKSGALYGTVNQSPILEGKLAADYAYYWLTGQQSRVPRPEAFIPLPLITKENVAETPADWSN